ncbi:MAG: hypothetical protein AAGG02_05340 [Cyanobacteria bacterium P01_H01_bin.15]
MSAVPSRSELPRHSRRRNNVHTLPERPPLPLWLRLFSVVQRGTSIFTFGLVVGMLFIYSRTTDAPEQWNKAYKTLMDLERSERQLLGVNETLKEQLSQEALSGKANLVDPEPSRILFVPANPAPDFDTVVSTAADSAELALEPLLPASVKLSPTDRPLAY